MTAWSRKTEDLVRALPVAVLLAWLVPRPAAAQARPSVAGPGVPALGIAMEEWPYPFPVHFLPLEVEGQPVRMAYMDVSALDAGTRGTVLLLHGKNFSAAYWEATIRALAQAGFRVIAPDQIGFGKSGKPDVHYSFDFLAANTARLLDALGIARVAVVGHSMGGMLAVRFARSYPQRTSRLILENPIGLEDYRLQIPPQPIDKLFGLEMALTDPDAIRAVYRRYVAHWKPEYERFVEARARMARSGEFPRFAQAAARTSEMIYQQPVRGEFRRIAVATLLVIGQEDRTTIGRGWVPEEALQGLGNYPQLGKDAQRDIPGSKLIELSDVAHIPHLEAPETFHRALIDFLEGGATASPAGSPTAVRPSLSR